jgi:hypothetical protein
MKHSEMWMSWKEMVRIWLKVQPNIFYYDGISIFEDRWTKYIKNRDTA